MPVYEYLCQDCQKKFTVRMSIAEHDRNRVQCPHCGGKQVVQQYSTFFARTSRKS